MIFPADTFKEAVDLSITASNQLHTILNGDSTTEVIVEDGSKIPSVRKAYIDSLFFLSPQPWSVGEYETVYNQLRAFIEPTGIATWWFSKTATVSTPILMSTTPHEDSNWTLWNAINNSVYEIQKRLAAEVGLKMVGSFLLGATVTDTDEVVFYETDGKYYKWGGELPKTILAGTNPHLHGGIGITAWIDSASYLLKDEVDYNKNKAETDYQSGILSFTTDTGTTNAYTCKYSPAITSRIEGQVLRFKVARTNTGASTFNDGVGVVPLVGGAFFALQGGELVAGGTAWVQWHSTVGTGSYVLLFCSGAPMQVANGNKSQHTMALGQFPAQATSTGLIKKVNRLIFTASGTYTPSTGMVYADVEIVGGGGQGGGALGITSGSSAGAGGGAGSYAKKTLTAVQIGASQIVTIGAGGTGSVAGNNAGGGGGTTSFGALLTATGGAGGAGSAGSTVAGIPSMGGGGGTASGGDINIRGGSGFASFVLGGTSGGLSGQGGSNIYGAGGYPSGPTGSGNSGHGYGAGGSGGAVNTTGSAQGAAGLPGLCIITEYCTQ